MALRDTRLLVRKRGTSGGAVPANALFGEPFINTFDGILKFTGTTGGGFETSAESGVFEVGSTLYNSRITNRLNVNDNFIVSGTGLISTYGGASGAGLGGKFLSGTTDGFVLSNIADIVGVTTYVQPGANTFTGGTDTRPTVNVTGLSIDNISVSGSATFENILATEISATTFYSAGTNLETIITNLSDVSDTTRVQPGSNITTGGTNNEPIVSLVESPFVNDITISGTGLANAFSATTLSGDTLFSGTTDLSAIFLPAPSGGLTPGQVAYAGPDGIIKGEGGFEYDETSDTVSLPRVIIGDPSTTGETTATVYGNILLIGESVSAITSQLYIEDNRIELNFNPTASTESTSLGAGWSIQDGSGSAGTDVFLDIRGTATGVANRSFATNLEDLRIRETGTVSSPNGVRVLAEDDVLDGGTF